jgi:hypothetical protein
MLSRNLPDRQAIYEHFVEIIYAAFAHGHLPTRVRFDNKRKCLKFAFRDERLHALYFVPGKHALPTEINDRFKRAIPRAV